MNKDTDFFANIPHVKPDDRKVEPSNRPEDILVRNKVKFLNTILEKFEGEPGKKVFKYGSKDNRFREKARNDFLEELNKDECIIIKRQNNEVKHNFEVSYIKIPRGLIGCDNNKDCLSTEEVQVLNKWFLSPFWNQKMKTLVEDDPSNSSKKRHFFERDLVFEADDMLHTSLCFESPEYLASGYYSDLYKVGSAAIGRPVDRDYKKRIERSKEDKKWAFAIAESAFFEARELYGEDNPLVQYYLFDRVGKRGEMKFMDYIKDSTSLPEIGSDASFSRQEILCMIRDVSRALSLLHKEREIKGLKGKHWVTHNDLHGRNVMSIRDQSKQVKHAKVIDYGSIRMDGDRTDDLFLLGTLMDEVAYDDSTFDRRFEGFKDYYEIAHSLQSRDEDMTAEVVLEKIEKMLEKVSKTK